MSAWRRVAIEKIPRYRKLIQRADTIGMLWVDLWLEFVHAHSDPIDEELVGQVYDYAWWCANAPDPDTSTAGVLSFYEDLPLYPAVRAQMAKWLPAEVFAGMGQIFRYHLDSYEEYREFVQQFYEQRERLGSAAARSDEQPLTDEQFQARISEAVTSLQDWKRQHGEPQSEYMARATIIENKEAMERLAPALQPRKGSAHAIAAAITPILRSLIASGAVPFPADPLTFAAAAMLLSNRESRSGAARDRPEEGRTGSRHRR
jgi:hypothetical protein